jgi:eukaryotic-like serine/threonine-protein kinase
MNNLHNPGDIVRGRYQILDILGQGGTAITYVAQDLENQIKVAIKVLSLHQINDWKVLELFEREAKILANLQHPYIPEYLDYFQVEIESDTPTLRVDAERLLKVANATESLASGNAKSISDRTFYLVQQIAPGKSLFDWINQGWKPSIVEVQEIAAQILEILVYLQQLTPAVIHRDIKPQNIIRQPDGKIFLVDFGAVQDTYHNTVTGGSTVVGTFGYMAPEQFQGRTVLSTDLYGLGATLLFLLTGKSPVDLPQSKLKINFQASIKLPKSFADWLECMIEPVSNLRFTSAPEALAVLLGQQPLPKHNSIPQRPKNTQIKLFKGNGQLTIDIPNTLLKSQQSLFCGLFPLLISVFVLAILYSWAVEIIEPNLEIEYGKEFKFRSLFMMIFGIIPFIHIWLNAAQSLLFSSVFNTSIRITPFSEVDITWQLGLMKIKNKTFPHTLGIIQASLKNYNFFFFKPKFNLSYPSPSYCQLKTSTKQIKFGLFLSREEKVWIIDEIRNFNHNFNSPM